jgi:hypothetical protein
MGNYINAADIPTLRYENGIVTDASLEKTWGAL